MENLVSQFESKRKLQIEEISQIAENDVSDWIHYKVKLKYDTQATVNDIVDGLEERDKLKDGIKRLEEEIVKQKLLLDTLPEYEQAPVKAYMDGLYKALQLLAE